MKKKWTAAACVMAVVLCAVSIYSYFHVTGRQIELMERVSDACTVTVVQYPHMEYDKRREYVLDAGQIERLKALFLESSFTRDLANWVTFQDRDIYDIQIDFNNHQDFISVHCLGGEYISVPDQFHGKHLKINNRNWKAALEEIIRSPDAK